MDKFFGKLLNKINYFFNLILKTKINTNNEIINIKSHVKKSWLEIPLINWKFLILFPIKTDIKKTGVKPIKVTIINLNIEISNNDKMIFWSISGSPGINLKIIRYSTVEWEIYLLIFWAYFL